MFDSRKAINNMCDEANNGLNVHNYLKTKNVGELRTICDNSRNPFGIVCLNVLGELNIGTMIRNSTLFGAQEVLVLGRRRFDKRGVVGASNYIPVAKVDAMKNDWEIDPDVFVSELKKRNWCPVFAELGGLCLGSFDWHEVIANMNGQIPAIVMGNENSGISDELLATRSEFAGSQIVSIPQKGVIRSFNVGVAHGIICSNMCLDLGWL